MYPIITESELMDELLGLQVERIEKNLLSKAIELQPKGDLNSWGSTLHDGNQTWVGLALETLQTPYSEIKMMLDLLKPRPFETVVDLGAAYGRMGIVLERFYPEVQFLGFEYVRERVEAAVQVLKKGKLIQQDLTHPDFEMPVANYYFIYDYGKVQHIRRTLQQLDQLADRHTFKVIARGKGTRSLIEKEHPWLSQVHPPHHEEKFSIYSMAL